MGCGSASSNLASLDAELDSEYTVGRACVLGVSCLAQFFWHKKLCQSFPAYSRGSRAIAKGWHNFLCHPFVPTFRASTIRPSLPYTEEVREEEIEAQSASRFARCALWTGYVVECDGFRGRIAPCLKILSQKFETGKTRIFSGLAGDLKRCLKIEKKVETGKTRLNWGFQFGCLTISTFLKPYIGGKNIYSPPIYLYIKGSKKVEIVRQD